MSTRTILLQASLSALGLALAAGQVSSQAAPAAATPFGDPANRVAGELRVLDDDGAWSWFEGERAIVAGGRLWVGAVASGGSGAERRGDVYLIAEELASGELRRIVLADRFETDDHDSPALLQLGDGRLMAAYSKHGTDSTIRIDASVDASLEEFAAVARLDVETGGHGVTYSNLYALDDEGQQLIDLFRGAGWSPNLIRSTDAGATWSDPQRLLSGAGRPYLRYARDDAGRVHFAVSEQHPRDFDSGIRHGFLEGDAVYGSTGEVLGEVGPEAPAVEVLTQVFAGAPDAVAWCNDVRIDAEGHPVIVYSVQLDGAGLPAGQGGRLHEYRYARFDGESWHDQFLAWAGTRLYAGEDDYTGLAVLDPADPGVVVFSTDADPILGAPLMSGADGERHRELFWARTANDGASWVFGALTEDSSVDNIRPVFAAGADADAPAQLVWLRGRYRSYQDYSLAVVALQLSPELKALTPAAHPPPPLPNPFSDALERPAIEQLATGVARWQITHPAARPGTDWTQATFSIGLLHWAMTCGDDELLDSAAERLAELDYGLGGRPLMADDYAIGYAHQQLALARGDHSIVAKTRRGMEFVLAQAQDESLEWKDGIWDREWAWCDALFMGPPTLAGMHRFGGDPAYLERADRLWWKTTEFLYDPYHHLFFRDDRYREARDERARRVFWCRGNGWVLGGLVRVLEVLPEDHPSRDRYVTLLREMAAALLDAELESGGWTSSLLAYADGGRAESSGTGLITYALAWGLNRGLLDEPTYRPLVDRAWRALAAAVHADGMLGWVQVEASTAGPTDRDATGVYGSGAFLLAAAEMWTLLER